MIRVAGAALAVALAGCEGGSGGAPDAAAPADPQHPPIGQRALEAWLAGGDYQSWRCEQTISPVRLNGAHGRHRICWNDVLAGSTAGHFPLGAASVKELYDSADRPNGFAVGLKVAAGPGDDTWYWYERTGTSPTSRPVADGVGFMACGPACHASAPRDNVFIRP